MAFDKRSQVALTFGTYKIHCLIRFNISRKYYDFGLKSYIKMNISRFSHINALGIKFDIAINKVKVNLDLSFEQTW